jgi:hypothetical protein
VVWLADVFGERMRIMKQPSDRGETQGGGPAPVRRQWSKPEIVVYGHLAKLTRGPSGMYAEAGGMSKTMSVCL